MIDMSVNEVLLICLAAFGIPTVLLLIFMKLSGAFEQRW